MTGRKKSTSKASDPKDDEEAKGGVEVELGGLFERLGDVVDLVGKLAEAGEKHVERRGEFRVKGLGDQARGVYGFSVRSGIGGGKPKVEPFGNVHASEDGLVVDDVREPLADVFDENDEIVIVAELPGVAESNIAIRFESDTMMMIKTRGERHYVKEVALPSAVDPKTLKKSYNNGVLEARVDKRK